jgi:glutamyl-tRNA reductase
VSPRGVERVSGQDRGTRRPAIRGAQAGRPFGGGAAGEPGIDTLDALAVVGVAIPDAPLALRRRVAQRLHADAGRDERVEVAAAVLATCARGEIYGFAPARSDGEWCARFAAAVGGLDAADLAAVRVRRGADAVRHLFRVAGGLASSVVGEHEVLGQVRAVHAALDRSLRSRERPAPAPAAEQPTPAEHAARRFLRHLFGAAVAAGRRARADSGLGALATSHAELAVAAFAARVGDPRSARVGVVGGGALGSAVARALAATGVRSVTVFARHPERVQRSFRVLAASALEPELAELDALITAARAPSPMFDASRLAAARPGLVVIDLGMPPNVEPTGAASIQLVTLDGLASAPARTLVARAEEIVARQAERFVRWAAGRAARLSPATLDAPLSSARPPAVLLAAHGAGDDSIANRRVRQLARRLARRLPGTVVGVGFTLGAPSWDEAASRLQRASGGELVVVPVLTSAGYFGGRRLPAAVDRWDSTTRITPPLGTHPRVVGGVVARTLERLREARGEGPVVCLVVGHGTARAAAGGEATEAVAGALRQALTGAGLDVDVATAFLDQEPLLEQAVRKLVAARIVVVPFLVGGGPHLEHDLAARLARATAVPCAIGHACSTNRHSRAS